ncbi:MAG: GntR family transcriptional regulator [Planctomycetes bacterium]|nr:GntR family transcriptional regulator [Planctomycetota bacterium]
MVSTPKSGSAKPKHVAAREYIEGLIASGRYRVGDRLPSENELATRFQATRPTVARALRDLSLLGFVERRHGSGTYVRDRALPAATDGKRLGVLIPDLGRTEIFEPICGEVVRQAQPYGHAVVWGDMGETADLDSQSSLAAIGAAVQACQGLIDQQVAGVLFAPFEGHAFDDELNTVVLRELRAAGVQVVLLDRDVVPFPERSRYDLVGIDNLRGGFMATRYLLELGRRQVCFVARPRSAPTVERRIAGYCEALRQAGLPSTDDGVCLGDPLDLEFVRGLLRDRQADGLVCANDITAAALMQSLSQLNYRVPADVAVIGFDDVKYARLLATPLTTIRIPCADLGRAAFAALRERMDGSDPPPRAILLEPELIVRKSCGGDSATPSPREFPIRTVPDRGNRSGKLK